MRTKPKIELDLEKVEEYAGLGLTREEIALSLGVSYSTLNRRVKESEEVDAAMKRGRAKANIKVGNALMKAIEGGNVTAIIFYLKIFIICSNKFCLSNVLGIGTSKSANKL